jgi:hypothetical protein
MSMKVSKGIISSEKRQSMQPSLQGYPPPGRLFDGMRRGFGGLA